GSQQGSGNEFHFLHNAMRCCPHNTPGGADPLKFFDSSLFSVEWPTVSLTPNFSWVGAASPARQPFQRFIANRARSQAKANLRPPKETADAVKRPSAHRTPN